MEKKKKKLDNKKMIYFLNSITVEFSIFVMIKWLNKYNQNSYQSFENVFQFAKNAANICDRFYKSRLN